MAIPNRVEDLDCPLIVHVRHALILSYLRGVDSFNVIIIDIHLKQPV